MRLDLTALKFLVIDDNVHMRRIVRSHLRSFEVQEIYEADGGARGLQVFEDKSPDIVITDWVMPDISGLELVRAIRNPESKLNPFVPIIMLTAHAVRQRVIDARDAGVHEFLCKPLSAKALYERIANVVLHPRPFIHAKSYFGPDRRRFQFPNWCGAERRGRDGVTMDIEDFVARSASVTDNIAI